MAKLMHEKQRKEIKQLRRLSKHAEAAQLSGFDHRMKQKIRMVQYEIFSTEKADRRKQQRAKQEQERLRFGGSENPWCGWCN
jgi:hypothetical protein